MKKLGVIFGGPSLEHEVSVITAVQLMKHVDRSQYELVPIYIDKQGRWWTGERLSNIETFRTLDINNPKGLEHLLMTSEPEKQLVLTDSLAQPKNATSSNKIDVAILCFHGSPGESGQVQGLLELAGIPHQGPGMLGSVASFDKIAMRQIFAAENIPQTPYTWFTQTDWQTNQQRVISNINKLKSPWFVKAANSGSSIGTIKADNENKLKEAIEAVMHYDDRIIVEQGVDEDFIEVNISLLGDNISQPKMSVTEQPVKSEEILSFADKYEKGGKKSGMASLNRRIPAPISSSLTEKIQDMALKVWQVLDLSGVVRIDTFANPTTEEILITEPNTIPGSMSFYLWVKTDLPYPKLIDELVKIAESRQQHETTMIRSFDTSILKTAKI